MNTWIVIAAYNMEPQVGKVIDGLHASGYKHIVVVDDGSKDNTFHEIQQHNATALRHIINRGQGAALKTGIDYALLQNADILVTFDADGQHLPSDIPALIAPVKNHEVDLTLGSRFLQQNDIPFIRKIILKIGALIIGFMYGIYLSDSHNGLRALSRKAAQAINITADRFEHASEIIDEIARKKLTYQEIPVTIKYTDYSQSRGQSSSNAIRIFYKMVVSKLFK